jgi:hypothetical protein
VAFRLLRRLSEVCPEPGGRDAGTHWVSARGHPGHRDRYEDAAVRPVAEVIIGIVVIVGAVVAVVLEARPD